MFRGGGVNETQRLLTVHRLVEMAVKKGVLHVQLVNRPSAGGGDAKNSLDHRWFDNKAERLIVVDVVALGEATEPPSAPCGGQGSRRSGTYA